MKSIGYYNGVIAPTDEIKIPMNDRVVYFGDGVYDAAFIFEGKPFALDDHLDRFYSSCKQINIAFDMPRGELEALLRDLCSRLDTECGMLYWQATRGTAPRSHIFPTEKPLKPNLLAYVSEKPRPDMTKKVKLITVPDRRYEFCNIKTLNLIPNCLAATAAEDAGCQEAVFHRGPIVTECAHSNCSIIAGGHFITHPLNRFILPGTVRRHVISICRELAIPVEEREFTIDELAVADEIVLTSATALVRSACELNGSPAGGRAPELLAAIQNAYAKRIFG